MEDLGKILYIACDVYTYIIIATVVSSWLIAFNVISMRNNIARKVISFLGRATDPVFRPIRRLMPSLGGMDLSPIIVLFGLMFLQNIILRVFFA